MSDKDKTKDITNSPKDLTELWRANSPIYHDEHLSDEEHVDLAASIRNSACRDLEFILADYADIEKELFCELRVIRYGIDVRVHADPKLFFETLAWAVHGNENCSEFLRLYPESKFYNRQQVFDLLYQLYFRVIDFVLNQMNSGKIENQKFQFSGPMHGTASGVLDGFNVNFSVWQPHIQPPFCNDYSSITRAGGSYKSGTARRKTGRVKNQLREISIAVPPAPTSSEENTVPIHPMVLDNASSSESVVAAVDNQSNRAGIMNVSPLCGRDEGKNRRRRYKLIYFPGVSGTELIPAPKGVYKTASGFRVQLNVGTHQSQRKFSRNAPLVHNALWLYEIAILMADSPQNLRLLLKNGNFLTMKSLKMCSDEMDYHTKLLENIHRCFQQELLDVTERDLAVMVGTLLHTI